MEIKHSPEQPMDQRRNWKGNLKGILRQIANRNATYQNLWDAANVILRGKFIVINAYIKK